MMDPFNDNVSTYDEGYSDAIYDILGILNCLDEEKIDKRELVKKINEVIK